jgi:hypothetical protein
LTRAGAFGALAVLRCVHLLWSLTGSFEAIWLASMVSSRCKDCGKRKRHLLVASQVLGCDIVYSKQTLHQCSAPTRPWEPRRIEACSLMQTSLHACFCLYMPRLEYNRVKGRLDRTYPLRRHILPTGDYTDVKGTTPLQVCFAWRSHSS